MITPGTKHWDGTEALPYMFDDGGRSQFFNGSAGDCVTRAVAIASGMPYDEVYERLAHGTGAQRASSRTKKKGRSARNGINTKRKWFKDFMDGIGFEWVPCMKIGEGCKVHLLKGELPEHRVLIVALSKHYTTVIDGVIHDTFDPTRATIYNEGDRKWMTHRCVYGYWREKS